MINSKKCACSLFLLLNLLVEGAIAGAAAGVVVEAVLYPIDTIKTRLQAGLDCLTFYEYHL